MATTPNGKNQSLQDNFLHMAKDARTQVTFFLINGYQLRGIIKNFDTFTVLVMKEGNEYLIFKSAIASLMPAKPLFFANSQNNKRNNNS